ncbi:MAG: RluA family pseudouridine synthase [Clostridiales bacterium]|jgi:23S rRNA pseudouridine1911/1915/1917 synthase|nr:RluA family pseudouridine synthase [Clostridiales bacterium]
MESKSFEPIILYEDNHLLVVVKQQNMLSQADKSGDEDLLSLLKEYIKDKYKKPGNVFLGLVHRLDRPTGGVMVFARTSKAAERLSQQIREGDFIKKYFAVVEGIPKDNANRLIHYLMKDTDTNTVVLAPSTLQGAKKCILDYKVLESVERYSFIEITLITGRSHQARVQLKSIGHPIVGDQRYGGATAPNLALWAYELKFVHPTTNKHMAFKVFPPQNKVWQTFNVDRYVNVFKPD